MSILHDSAVRSGDRGVTDGNTALALA